MPAPEPALVGFVGDVATSVLVEGAPTLIFVAAWRWGREGKEEEWGPSRLGARAAAPVHPGTRVPRAPSHAPAWWPAW